MTKTTTADNRGRIVIPQEMREKFGDRYRVVELRDRIELIPLSDDPTEGLRDAVGDAFKGKSTDEIKREARDKVREEIASETVSDGVEPEPEEDTVQ
ncbi:MAG: AbrB/MazE/SpoVT family DNA-binding domain-containing protein [Halobacteria archaeon]|nr:AbrB/MazE/SpoVT family DNA-binding domain-containing protein [Halobacteria archaeon]